MLLQSVECGEARQGLRIRWRDYFSLLPSHIGSHGGCDRVYQVTEHPVSSPREKQVRLYKPKLSPLCSLNALSLPVWDDIIPHGRRVRQDRLIRLHCYIMPICRSKKSVQPIRAMSACCSKTKTLTLDVKRQVILHIRSVGRAELLNHVNCISMLHKKFYGASTASHIDLYR
ncbi:hypothetical protein BDN67DRAFT_969072 [Paxillus ammoniavirescens]|nr:hypothetical protein BDN67DRAFT_969072 [Paxillus ammoniavirescens]